MIIFHVIKCEIKCSYVLIYKYINKYGIYK